MTSANCKPDDDQRRLSALYVVALYILVMATLPLWIGRSDFPKIPIVSGLIATPAWIDLALLVAFQVVPFCFLRSGSTRTLSAVATVFVITSTLLNQHRIQVWAYHLCIAGLIASFSDRERVLSRLRWLTIGIYAWSALSKFDLGFVNGPGRTLWEGLLAAVRFDASVLPAGVNQAAPWLMPAGELAAALALAIPRWRRLGLWFSITMHLVLLLAVGPLGLGHEAGVQIWNGLFIIQNLILFRRCGPQEATEHAAEVREKPGFFGEAGPLNADSAMAGLLAFVLTMPALQPWNYWDVWPSWAVYSARGGWTTIFVHHDDIERLPPAAARFVGEPAPLSDWHPVDIDAWSLAELHCPVYPQPRFRLAIAAALSKETRIQVERRSPPDRWTGKSSIETVEISGGRLPKGVEREFWLNVTGRSVADAASVR